MRKYVILEGITLKGIELLSKSRTRMFEVSNAVDTVGFDPKGKRMLLVPRGQTAFHECAVWVYLENDVDFKVKWHYE